MMKVERKRGREGRSKYKGKVRSGVEQRETVLNVIIHFLFT